MITRRTSGMEEHLGWLLPQRRLADLSKDSVTGRGIRDNEAMRVMGLLRKASIASTQMASGMRLHRSIPFLWARMQWVLRSENLASGHEERVDDHG